MVFEIDTPLDASLNKFSLEYSYAELLETTSNFDSRNELGRGSYGAVFRGIQKDGTDVAVKVLEMPKESGFEEEVRVLSKFRHPNLVILMGFARKGSVRYLIYEMLAGGDCYNRLQNCAHNGQSFTWRERTSAAFDAACGLSHLHHATPKVFHRDIKTANILLDRNGTAKMADFGLACLSHALTHKVEKTAGTLGYACPLYAKRSVVTQGSEAYSFGVVMLEMLTNICPAILLQYPNGVQNYRFLVHKIQGSVDIAVKLCDARASWPLELARNFARLALRCVEEQEDLRPGFAAIVHNLRYLREYAAPEVLGEVDRVVATSADRRQDVHKVVSPSAAPAFVQQPQLQPCVAMYAHQPPQAIRLWSLRCIFADVDHFNTLSQDRLTISQWQSYGDALATSLHVGRKFQRDLFHTLIPESASNSPVSRDHFQILAEQHHIFDDTERVLATCVPCSFVLVNFSQNGTLLNGVKIQSECEKVQIHNGDTISIPKMIKSNGTKVLAPLIEFQFDLSGSILRDTKG